MVKFVWGTKEWKLPRGNGGIRKRNSAYSWPPVLTHFQNNYCGVPIRHLNAMRATFISRITAILLLGIECVAQSSPVSVNSNAILDLMGQIPPCGVCTFMIRLERCHSLIFPDSSTASYKRYLRSAANCLTSSVNVGPAILHKLSNLAC
jgi:hypothetical protein